MAQIQRFGNRPNIAEATFRGFQQGEQIRNAPLRQRASELSLDRQEVENQRFLDDANLRSMVDGALEFKQIDPNDNQAQIKFLQNRAEQINDRGGDPRDTLELIQMPMSQRPAAVEGVLNIARQKGLIESPKQERQDLTSMAKGLVEEGFRAGTPEFQQELRKRRTAKKSPLVQVNTGEKIDQAGKIAEIKEFKKGQAQQVLDLIAQGEAARPIVNQLKQMLQIDVKKGALEPAKKSFAAFIDGLGFPAQARKLIDLDAAVALGAASSKITNDIVGTFKGTQTEGDVERVKRTVGGISDPDKGFKFKVKSMLAPKLREIERADFLQRLTDEGQSPSEARAEWNKFIKRTPMLSSAKAFQGRSIPMFFFEYKNLVKRSNETDRAKNPNIPLVTDEQIIEGWRNDAK